MSAKGVRAWRCLGRPGPSRYYQTVFSTDLGSAEMPSAGRGFTPDLVARLRDRGVRIAPVVLHTGVSSLEEDEPPYPEFFQVPVATAILTGWHEPRSSHLAMLAALAGQRHLRLAYREALDRRFLWHEFGALHLIL